MTQCAFPSCDKPIYQARAMICWPHWSKLPARHRQAIWSKRKLGEKMIAVEAAMKETLEGARG